MYSPGGSRMRDEKKANGQVNWFWLQITGDYARMIENGLPAEQTAE